MNRIPIGIEDFKELIDKNYYVDKTKFIDHTINEKVVFYTRPRRFGKTLNISMLYYFYSLKEKENAYLFNDLEITRNNYAMKHQNQYPVISISLKDVKRLTMEDQIEKFSAIISNIIKQNIELLDSPYIEKYDKQLLHQYKDRKSSFSDIQDALLNISYCMFQHYQKKVIILIDEYDVPLQYAYENKYYDQMTNFISNTFSACLKTNDALEKGILTGCLPVAKESIFTGLNNFKVYSIFDNNASSFYGFTQNETLKMLKDYHLENYYDKVKTWYDGYLFGNTEIYNPWSVIRFIDDSINENLHFESYWANTSSNNLVYDYIQKGNKQMKDEFQKLIDGKSIIKEIMPEMTYRDMNDIDNIYSFLLFTGYLKMKCQALDSNQNPIKNTYELIIPNFEVKEIYDNQYKQYFRIFSKDKKKELLILLKQGKSVEANQLLNQILFQSISFFDNYESYYHGFMTGLFSEYNVKSNREYGNGHFDIAILTDDVFDTNIIIECKWTKNRKDLRKLSEEAKNQIINNKYIEGLKEDGYENIIGYGIAFYKKSCIITKV